MMTQWGDLPAVQLALPNGASATITLFGAHLVSWKDCRGQEQLFCSTLSQRDGKKAIRGGVPVIFPQFAERGTGLRHGFARVSTWRLETSGAAGDSAFARFVLEPSDLATPWTNDFLLRLSVTLRADSLAMAMDVINSGDKDLTFAAALHSYYLVDTLAEARIIGLQDEPLVITEKLDKIFDDAENSLQLKTGGRTLAMTQSGFSDTVVWNPGEADTKAMPDMEDEEYKHFVCVEPALVEPLTLAPARSWRGELVLSSIL